MTSLNPLAKETETQMAADTEIPIEAWEACTLPVAERPFRQAEFDELLATAVRSVEQLDQLRLRFHLTADPAVAAQAADLAVRETECCSFFTFTLGATGGRLQLDVAVPEHQARLLAVMAEQAEAGTGHAEAGAGHAEAGAGP